MTPSSQDHIEKLLDLAVLAFCRAANVADTAGRLELAAKDFRRDLSSSLHQLAEAQKEKALEIVRGKAVPPPVAGMATNWTTIGYNQALSEVEEAIKKEL
jgi:hypothetical protein